MIRIDFESPIRIALYLKLGQLAFRPYNAIGAGFQCVILKYVLTSTSYSRWWDLAVVRISSCIHSFVLSVVLSLGSIHCLGKARPLLPLQLEGDNHNIGSITPNFASVEIHTTRISRLLWLTVTWDNCVTHHSSLEWRSALYQAWICNRGRIVCCGGHSQVWCCIHRLLVILKIANTSPITFSTRYTAIVIPLTSVADGYSHDSWHDLT